MLWKKPIGQWKNQRGNEKISPDKWKWKQNNPNSVGCSKSSSKREVYGNTVLPQETIKQTKKISNNLNLHLKEREAIVLIPMLIHEFPVNNSKKTGAK